MEWSRIRLAAGMYAWLAISTASAVEVEYAVVDGKPVLRFDASDLKSATPEEVVRSLFAIEDAIRRGSEAVEVGKARVRLARLAPFLTEDLRASVESSLAGAARDEPRAARSLRFEPVRSDEKGSTLIDVFVSEPGEALPAEPEATSRWSFRLVREGPRVRIREVRMPCVTCDATGAFGDEKCARCTGAGQVDAIATFALSAEEIEEAALSRAAVRSFPSSPTDASTATAAFRSLLAEARRIAYEERASTIDTLRASLPAYETLFSPEVASSLRSTVARAEQGKSEPAALTESQRLDVKDRLDFLDRVFAYVPQSEKADGEAVRLEAVIDFGAGSPRRLYAVVVREAPGSPGAARFRFASLEEDCIVCDGTGSIGKGSPGERDGGVTCPGCKGERRRRPSFLP